MPKTHERTLDLVDLAGRPTLRKFPEDLKDVFNGKHWNPLKTRDRVHWIVNNNSSFDVIVSIVDITRRKAKKAFDVTDRPAPRTLDDEDQKNLSLEIKKGQQDRKIKSRVSKSYDYGDPPRKPPSGAYDYRVKIEWGSEEQTFDDTPPPPPEASAQARTESVTLTKETRNGPDIEIYP